MPASWDSRSTEGSGQGKVALSFIFGITLFSSWLSDVLGPRRANLSGTSHNPMWTHSVYCSRPVKNTDPVISYSLILSCPEFIKYNFEVIYKMNQEQTYPNGLHIQSLTLEESKRVFEYLYIFKIITPCLSSKYFLKVWIGIMQHIQYISFLHLHLNDGG